MVCPGTSPTLRWQVNGSSVHSQALDSHFFLQLLCAATVCKATGSGLYRVSAIKTISLHVWAPELQGSWRKPMLGGVSLVHCWAVLFFSLLNTTALFAGSSTTVNTLGSGTMRNAGPLYLSLPCHPRPLPEDRREQTVSLGILLGGRWLFSGVSLCLYRSVLYLGILSAPCWALRGSWPLIHAMSIFGLPERPLPVGSCAPNLDTLHPTP